MSVSVCVRRSNWPAVFAVAAATFAVVTTEMLPVGLITPMSSAAGVSEGTAGLTMTVPGLVAAVSAPLLTLLTARFDRRVVLAALAATLAVANLVSAWAPGFAVLLAARVLVGVAIGGVWSIAAGLASRLVPEEAAGRATAMIFSGVAVASVLGVPAGTIIGQAAGWRAAFVVVGVLALAVLAALVLALPPLPPVRALRLGDVPGLLREPRLRAGLVLTLLLVTGHFAAYTYVRPVLERVSGIDSGLVGALLLAYGVAGIAGNFAAGSAASRHLRRTVLVITGALAVAVLLTPVAGTRGWIAVGLLVLWGLAYGGVSVSLQIWLLGASSRAPEAGSALFVAAFNVSIALGALLGGRVLDAFGTASVMWLGGALAVLAMLTAMPTAMPTTMPTTMPTAMPAARLAGEPGRQD
ncbi:MFS transporter [Actinomadura barringtoniae]|uniref:MFS transporter n=1 Tax=Actinomadura barringtoniae TaxID=1427535 RepID=A0A939T7S6_9ACTN|nr:MFS transporter [Actinomadura barringtoniae]MBO2446170.1 MFS transporter [Actinomadura barringtoniae]